jgi:hypothetical protein
MNREVVEGQESNALPRTLKSTTLCYAAVCQVVGLTNQNCVSLSLCNVYSQLIFLSLI